MVFNLAVSFAGLKLSESVRASLNTKSAMKDLSEYGLMIADMVVITDNGAHVMTKFGKAREDISYLYAEDNDHSGEDNNNRMELDSRW